MKFTRAIAVGIAALFMGSAANASSYQSCVGTGYDLTVHVVSNLGCSIDTDNDQDFLNTNPMTVNEGTGFFGNTDWAFQFKSGTGQSGTWDTTGLTAFSEILLLFKSGNANSGVSIVGYSVAVNSSGTWTTPFTDPPFNLSGNSNNKDVSHISYYARGTGGGVIITPIPAGGVLMLTALGAAGMFGRRKSRKS